MCLPSWLYANRFNEKTTKHCIVLSTPFAPLYPFCPKLNIDKSPTAMADPIYPTKLMTLEGFCKAASTLLVANEIEDFICFVLNGPSLPLNLSI